MNPYVFIVGCPRSGTTLLRRIVDGHPTIAIPHRESHWITKLVRRGKVNPDGYVTPELLNDLLMDERFRSLLPEAELARSIETELPLPYPRFVTRVFDLYGEARGTTRVGDKTPGHVAHLPLLHRLWPEARFIHLIRDGRDVALSMRDWSRRPARELASWKDDPITTAAVCWRRLVRRGLEDGRPLWPGLYGELRYESLVAEPEAECAELSEFLGVDFDAAMLRFHEGREKSDPKLSAKKAWRPVTVGLRDWTAEMQEDELERFEAAAGDLLEELGYPRTVARPSRQALDLAARVQELVDESAPASQGATTGSNP